MYTFMPGFYNLVQNLVEGTHQGFVKEGGRGGDIYQLEEGRKVRKNFLGGGKGRGRHFLPLFWRG